MIYDIYIYVAPTLIAILVFHLSVYRDRRQRALQHARFDLVDSTVELLIEAKKSGHLEEDIPSMSELKELLNDDDQPKPMSWDHFFESVKISKQLTSIPELVQPYKELAKNAIRLSLIKAPGRTSFATFLVVSLLFLGFGIHSLKNLVGKKSEVAGGSILSRIPVRFS
ncbi:MAG: hypothetical protein ACLFS4_06810 [Opitutales bacterium]